MKQAHMYVVMRSDRSACSATMQVSSSRVSKYLRATVAGKRMRTHPRSRLARCGTGTGARSARDGVNARARPRHGRHRGMRACVDWTICSCSASGSCLPCTTKSPAAIAGTTNCGRRSKPLEAVSAPRLRDVPNARQGACLLREERVKERVARALVEAVHPQERDGRPLGKHVEGAASRCRENHLELRRQLLWPPAAQETANTRTRTGTGTGSTGAAKARARARARARPSSHPGASLSCRAH
jgi:hypothetical protein